MAFFFLLLLPGTLRFVKTFSLFLYLLFSCTLHSFLVDCKFLSIYTFLYERIIAFYLNSFFLAKFFTFVMSYDAEEVVLISSDYHRIRVTRSIVTEASYVLRDLLDGLEAFPSRESSRLMLEPHLDSREQGKGDGFASSSSLSHSKQKKAPLEVPIPFITGDILAQVWEHMQYRFCTAVAVDNEGNNVLKVYPVPMKAIPKPMVLPLNDYLDANDRKFIADWDEERTIVMVKAATLLRYEVLLQLASAKLATFLIEKNVNGLRAMLGVECDFTSEEIAQLRKEDVDDEYF